MTNPLPLHDDLQLQQLRDTWISAENARTDAYRAFMEANRNSPLRRELNAAEAREKEAQAAYSRALQQHKKNTHDGTDTRLETADRD